MSFQNDVDSWRAKTHLSSIKPPVLIGICVLVVCVLLFVVGSVWNTMSNKVFSIETEETQPASKNTETDSLQTESLDGDKSVFAVHIGGEVVNPGVYELEEGSRIQHAIESAGGFSEHAARDAINLARPLTDGEQIIIPNTEEQSQPSTEEGTSSPAPSSSQTDQKININTASVSELTSLSGVGEATAQKIIDDREKNGPFSSTDDLKRVTGVGVKKFAQFANDICV